MYNTAKLITAGLCGLALTACGGDGGDDGNTVARGAVEACFTVPETVSFNVNYFGADGTGAVGGFYRRMVGPTTFNGQAATQSRTVTYVPDRPLDEKSSVSVYWAVTDSGIALLGNTKTQANEPDNSYISSPAAVIPLNIQPGQSVNLVSSQVVSASFDAPASFTFVGLETLTLSGKTFSDVCHFRVQGTPAGATGPVTNDLWYASGYGEIQWGYVPDEHGSVFRYGVN